MIRFFLERRVLTNLLSLFIVVVGGYHFLNVRKEAFPDVDYNWISVTTAYPGASPEEVERLVTKRIEDQLRTVSGIDRVVSNSIENRSIIFIQLNEDLSSRESDRVADDVEQAVSRVQDLPEIVDKPLVQELTSDRPLITLSVAGGTEEARHRFADELADVLEDIDGVSQVDRQGYTKKEIWIEADREKLSRNLVTTAEIAAAVRAHNVDMSAGTVEIGPKELWVRVVGALDTAEDVGAVILRGTDERSYLRIRDVARVTQRFEEARVITRANGRPSINLNVRKLKTGDTIKLADAVKRVRAEYEPRAKSLGMELVISDDISFFIKRRLHVMTNNLIQGGFLILAALFIFLDWRLALVAAWGVPMSLAAAFMVAVPLGFTVNLLSLIAFIIVLGMLDDDSVVVAENIYRHLEMGKKPFEAAVDGAKEVVVPVLASVTTTSCAFLPFAMMSGIMGKFLLMIPVIVVMSFAASAFEAFFVLPAHVVDLMPLGKPVEEKNDGHWYRKVLEVYGRAMTWVIAHRGKFALILLGFVALTVGVAKWRLKLVLFPPGLIDQVFIKVDMPQGTGLTETQKALEKIERAVLTLPPEELDAVTATVGMKGFEENIRLGTYYAQARVFFTPEETRERKTKVLVEELRQKIGGLPEAQKVVFEELHPGPPVGRAIQIRVRGRELGVIGRIADEVKREMQSMDGVTDIEDSREGGKTQLRLRLNPADAAYADVSVAQVAQNVLFAVDGGEVSEIRRPDERDEIKIKVRLAPEQRAQPRELLSLDVLNARGRPVPLGAIAGIETAQGPPFLERYNFRPVVTLTADVDLAKTTSREANALLMRTFRDVSKQHPGYELIFGGEEEETQKSMRSLFRAFGIAVLLDFVILAAVFRSYLQPFIILLTIPIGMLGVVYALLLHGKPASFMALLGIVAMTGVIVNNAIVLVEFINKKREEGMDVKTAAVEAGLVRLRPIWASSITTLLGLFPSAYGFGGYEPFVAPMALSLAWGLTIAMPMTLFLIPTAYILADDVTKRLRRRTQPLKEAVAGRIAALFRGRKGGV